MRRGEGKDSQFATASFLAVGWNFLKKRYSVSMSSYDLQCGKVYIVVIGCPGLSHCLHSNRLQQMIGQRHAIL